MSKEERVAKAHQIIGDIAKSLTDLVDIFMSDREIEDHPVVENKKKRRDPNAPKLPTSNFFLFTNSIREEVERENPDSTFAEKSKIYGARWQKLSDEERKPFNEKAKEEREKYNKEMAIYDGTEHSEAQSKKKVKSEPVPSKVSSSSSKTTKNVVAAPAPVSAKASKAAKTAPAPVPTKAASKAAAKATPTTKTAPARSTKPSKQAVQESSSSDSDSEDSSSSDSDDSD